MERWYEEKKELKTEFTQKQQEYAQQKETLKEAKQKLQQCQRQEPQRIPAMCITKCNAMYVHSLVDALVHVTEKECICTCCNELRILLASFSFQRQRVDSEHKDIPVCMRLIDFCQKVTKDYGNDRMSKRNKKVSKKYSRPTRENLVP